MKKEKTKKPAEDFLAKEAKEDAAQALAYTLDISEDEIWTYRIEGLHAPRIGKPIKNIRQKKILVVVILLIAIGLAIYFSIRAVHTVPFKYAVLEDGTSELVRFSNPGNVTTLTVDVTEDDAKTPVTALHEFAFNCDEKLTEITLGKTITSIEPTSFYSCWALQNIKVDQENPAFCDIDGVLYTKDLSRIVCYPIDHDKYLRETRGYADLKDENGKAIDELWGPTEVYDEAFYQKYNADTRTYVLPSTVTVIGEMAFNYANITDLYLPEGLREIETLGLFKCTSLEHIFTYTHPAQPEALADVSVLLKDAYPSLPESLETIGSDALTGNQGLSYLFIPAGVTYIGHHAFWDTCYKEDGELRGVSEICIALDEDTFRAQTTLGDHWRPQISTGLFPKNIAVRYGAVRES